MLPDFVIDVMGTIKHSIISNDFIDVESGKIELKDLSTGSEWTSLKETVCAFLNTEGGVVICGVRERNRTYNMTGFDRNNESKIIELQRSVFRDDHGTCPDLSSNIFTAYEAVTLNGNTYSLLVIVVYALSDDLKYISYNERYYERRLTQDSIIPAPKLQRHREYKQELEYAKEIAIIEGATINDLSLDKINRYVNLLNIEISRETLKPSIAKARTFLANHHFIKENQVTVLGMLVCGEDPFHFLSMRSEVNCYYDTSSDIGKDKKIFRSDVINLMKETFRYVWGNIKIGRTVRNGGASEAEYPEELIRETINNALAHRDYTIDRFVTINIEPNKHIEIKKPGRFKEAIIIADTRAKVPVRRLMPGIPESKNPKLASVLRVFDKIEGQGRGMAALVNGALNNKVDLPYYDISDNMISLRIPTGRLVDESMENWLKGFERYIETRLKTKISDEHKAVLSYFHKSEILNKKRHYTILLSESNNHFSVIEDLKNAGLIVEHTASSEEVPIYVLDRVLAIIDFSADITGILGSQYNEYPREAQEVLNISYLHTKYNQQALKAFEITPEVFRRVYGKTVVPKTYESLGRKVRKLCNDFAQLGILKKVEKGAYEFVFDFKSKNNLLI
jgi:ATP-dependent DNA helicase RecG